MNDDAVPPAPAPEPVPTASSTPASTHAESATPESATPESAAPTAVPAPPARRGARVGIVAGIAAACLVVGAGATAFGVVAASTLEARLSDHQGTRSGASSDSESGNGSKSGSSGNGSSENGSGSGSSGNGSGSSNAGSATAATAAQSVGVVTITSTLQYGQAKAAGTGMILTASGEVLTNNHVIEGATSISVTVASTGTAYTAKVVGTDSVDDLAVIQLQGASGLTPISLSSTAAQVGDTVTDVGNAGGTGSLTAATGTVTRLNQQITVQDDLTGASKQLTGLIELSADVQTGDSGGPVLSSSGAVVGIATAASTGSTNVTGYAIPIATAQQVVAQIDSGVASGNVRIGLPAFLGVTIASGTGTTAGVRISGTVAGSAAAGAGLVAGDTITAVDGAAVADATALTTVIGGHKPGDQIALSWTTASGTAQTATVTLGEGPAA